MRCFIFDIISYALCIVLVLNSVNCAEKQASEDNVGLEDRLIGTWKMIYGQIIENDSLQVKDLSKSDFIKVINESHFAFFNQENDGNENFYGGAGTYSLNGDDYVETLTFTAVNEIRNHEFPFKIKIKGDTLIQFGIEEIKDVGIRREIIEKYIKIKK